MNIRAKGPLHIYTYSFAFSSLRSLCYDIERNTLSIVDGDVALE